MCGIAGFVDFNKKLGAHELNKMTQVIHRRGPDDQGAKHTVVEQATVGFGHRRLSIIELSPLGHQPMSFDGLHIVFNGEIYNYQEIRTELIHAGFSFSSNSDTEVILKAFRHWGTESVQKFIGMFAFAIHDEKKQEIVLIRDRAGVKPFYYYFDQGTFLFGSELKSFHQVPEFKKTLDHKSLKLFFKYGYIPSPHSIFKNTFKVHPGQIIKLSLIDKTITKASYWDVVDYYNRPKLKIDFSTALEETERILISAFQYRMVADVPVGVFLSGGYDSSTVAAVLQKHNTNKIKTFSIGFEEQQYDEAHFARKVANHIGSDHTEHYCSVNEAKQILPQLPEIYDEPFGDSSAIPTILVSKIAAQQVKVALSADAGDEVFAGYGQFTYFIDQYNKFQKLPEFIKPLLTAAAKSLKLLKTPLSKQIYNFDNRLNKFPRLLRSQNIVEFNEVANEFYSQDEAQDLILNSNGAEYPTDFSAAVDFKYNDSLNAILAICYKTYLPDDILTKVDRATMSVGLEGREPLLDHRIIEFVSQLPSNFKYHENTPKHLLKEITHKYIPKSLMDRPKMGFSIPVESWLREDFRELLEHYLNDARIRSEGILNPIVVNRVKDDFLKGIKFNFSKLWYILMFQMWYDRWIKSST